MNEKIDLSDFSIIIPIKIDHQDRLDNLNTVLRFFEKYFINYEVVVLEHDSTPKCEFLKTEKNVIYQFNKSVGLMHRTQMLNNGMKMTNRKFVSSYDADVVFHPKAIEEAMKLLRDGNIFVFPYNGVFIDIFGGLKNNYITNLDHDTFPRYDSSVALYTNGKDYHVVHNRGLGGAVFFEKETFLKYGGYNKKFISWGYEDDELVCRFQKIGIKIVRVAGTYCIYHLNHFRSIDSSTNHEKIHNNKQELRKVTEMNKNTLIDYINNNLI